MWSRGTCANIHALRRPIPSAHVAGFAAGARPGRGGILRASPASGKVNRRRWPWPTPGSIAVGPPRHGSDTDPRGHADLLAGAHVVDVVRPQGTQPADLPAVVADDDLGENRPGQAHGALDAGHDVGIAGDPVEPHADAPCERL